MNLGTFFKFVEIQTKIASLFPFLIGLLFVIYRYEVFDPINTILFFAAMIIFDITTTAINNYMDFRKAVSQEYREKNNIIGEKQIAERVVVTLILTMLVIATALGLWLVYRTDLFVLLVGMICFAIGIFYTFGPIPLSRMPLGEVFSGVTMGFGITFLIIYVNAYDQGIAQFLWEGRTISLTADVVLLLEILLISLPLVFTIANLMLANNICDLEQDIENERYTLPYYLGKPLAIILFNALYVGSFLSIIVAVLLDLLPEIALFTLVVAIPVYKHVRLFNKKQVKSETFQVAVKNLVLVDGSLTVLLLLSLVVL